MLLKLTFGSAMKSIQGALTVSVLTSNARGLLVKDFLQHTLHPQRATVL